LFVPLIDVATATVLFVQFDAPLFFHRIIEFKPPADCFWVFFFWGERLITLAYGRIRFFDDGLEIWDGFLSKNKIGLKISDILSIN
jgi:hypothetical protein